MLLEKPLLCIAEVVREFVPLPTNFSYYDMSTLSKNFEPQSVEDKWYKYWLEQKYFKSTPDGRKPFTVVIPPPNVTGVLHMGHTLNETVQDILVRHARMNGFNACWVPGSDHASIATEAKVVQLLEKEKGIKKADLSREDFLKHAFEWKDKYGNIIYEQIKKLGCSVDWDRVTFTMDDHYYKAVIKVFVDLYEKGLIYRGARMINWDSTAKTALSDEEVEHRDVAGTLYYIKYNVCSENENTPTDEFIVIATQRPETIMGDTAVCVNPNDTRYAHLKGRIILVPLVNRKVPLIFDEYVDPAFGTGALKVTPAHDLNDYNLGLKHGLPIINTLNEDGTLSAAAEVFIGMDRFEAREKVVAKLRSEGLLMKEESYQTRLGFSQRSNSVVEPRISTQWFVKMRAMADGALTAVVDEKVKIHPEERFLATYKYWLENIKDWCISRQLWWGQRIPAWYDAEGRYVVAETKKQAIELFKQKHDVVVSDLRQDDDVLDTWFSSWLWPIEVFNGITKPENKEVAYYYPTSVLVTGQDIIFFWVARMIMAGMEYKGVEPFAHVYFTGMVRDKQGRKMSKSLGNSPDLLQLIDRFGADAVRFGIMIAAPAGNDLLFDDSSCDQGRSFTNKLWNALKLVKLWEEAAGPIHTASIQHFENPMFAAQWFAARLQQVQTEVADLYKNFKLSEALKTIYSLIWDDFCSWYLEWIKPPYGEALPIEMVAVTVQFFEELLHLLHPFMPFVTEEIYHQLQDRNAGDDLVIRQSNDDLNFFKSPYPASELLALGAHLKNSITAVRDARAKNNLKPKDELQLYILTENKDPYKKIETILCKAANAHLSYVEAAVSQAVTVAVGNDVFYMTADVEIDTAVQKEQLEKELDYLKGFLESVDKKLNNSRFVDNAKPEIVAVERRKKADAEQKILSLTESLRSLS